MERERWGKGRGGGRKGVRGCEGVEGRDVMLNESDVGVEKKGGGVLSSELFF